MEVDGSRRVAASGDAIWEVVSDANRVAEWLPTVGAARAEHNGTTVELEGDSHGHRYKMASAWNVSAKERALEWGGRDGYHGSLRVVEEGTGSSEIRVHVSIPEALVESSAGAEGEIRQGMEDALGRLSALVSR